MVLGQCGAGVVAINERFVVDVVHHQVEGPVAVEIAVRGAVREVGRGETPGGALVGEREIAVVVERVVGQLGRGHRPDEAHEIHVAATRRLAHRLVVRQEGHVILRRDVFGEPVRDEDVFLAVEIEIRDQRAPGPVGAGHAGHLSDVCEPAVAVVQLQHVAHELVVIALTQLGLIHVPALERRRRLEPAVVLGQHVGGVDVGPAVVVHVGDVEAHREVADGGRLAVQHFGEGAVALVDVEVVAFEEVVRDVDVGPAVAIDVAHDHAEAEPDLAPKDAGVCAHVHEVPAIVAVQLGSAERIALVALVAEAEARDGLGRVADQEQVQIAVAIVVEERGLDRVAGVGDAVGGGPLDERGDPVRVQPLVDVELVGAALPGDFPGVADVDVQPAVAVDVGDGDAGRPGPGVRDAGCGRDVPEVEAAEVQVESGAALVGREHHLRQAVARQVTERDAAAVVVVAVGEDVELAALGEAVLEHDAGLAGGEAGEQRGTSGGSAPLVAPRAGGGEARAGHHKAM